MIDITPEVLKKIEETLAQFGIEANLSAKEPEGYKPWEPELDIPWFRINYEGIVTTLPDFSNDQIQYFNCFGSERFAQLAAATDKINHCLWQWKEQFDQTMTKSYNSCFVDLTGSPDNKHWDISNDEWFGTFGPFSSEELAKQFLRDCRPYLDEYARTMGWL